MFDSKAMKELNHENNVFLNKKRREKRDTSEAHNKTSALSLTFFVLQQRELHYRRHELGRLEALNKESMFTVNYKAKYALEPQNKKNASWFSSTPRKHSILQQYQSNRI